MAQANLALRFVLELAGVIAVGYWGYHAMDGLGRWLLAFGVPALLIVSWALVVAPGADVPIPQPVREVIGSIVLLAAAGALYAAVRRLVVRCADRGRDGSADLLHGADTGAGRPPSSHARRASPG